MKPKYKKALVLLLWCSYSLMVLAQQPNILIIYTDQQSQWTVSAYGESTVETPNINRLADEGAMFTNFMANSAVCTPSRGSLLTGRYPNSNGAHANNEYLRENEITFAHRFKEMGYTTGYSGKLHLNGSPKPGWGMEGWSGAPQNDRGFTDNRFMFNRGHYKIIEEVENGTPNLSGMGNEQTYTTDWLAAKTIDFINENKDNAFCYLVSIPDPHSAFTVREPYSTMYNQADMALPLNYNNLDGQEVRSGDALTNFENTVRKHKAQYCGMVKLIDDCVGKILSCLEANNILDNTIIVYTTDHGEYMGEHGLFFKNKIWETAHRLPFLIRYPAKIEAGKVIENVCSVTDFHPTLLKLANLEPHTNVQGNSFDKLITGSDDTWVDEAIIYHPSNQVTGIFTPEYQYAFTAPGIKLESIPQVMLFNRLNDPHQLNNLANNANYDDLMKTLRAKVIAHHKALNTPYYEWLRAIEEEDNPALKNKGWHKHTIIIGN